MGRKREGCICFNSCGAVCCLMQGRINDEGRIEMNCVCVWGRGEGENEGVCMWVRVRVRW